MAITYAFDVYGTLIDPLAMGKHLQNLVGDEAPKLAQFWREKQLEYTFRRGLMSAYVPFDQVTAEALRYALAASQITVEEEKQAELLASYRALEAFSDTTPALKNLRAAGNKMWAFSNGTPDDLQALLNSADVVSLLDGVVSVDEVQSFKPDPNVYKRFCERAGSAPEQTCLVSSNPFDIIGALNCGWQTAWVQRTTGSIFDPWQGFTPDRTISSLEELIQT
ncbi:MAG: haloacid dehalogenase type II [Pseudomonadota bacterium]